jgi:uncharacterized membrane protein YuzA (DUF378 family)
MTGIGDLIPWAMLGVLIFTLIAGVLARPRGIAFAVFGSMVLYALSWWFPVPGEAEEAATRNLHPFSVNLLLLILTVAGAIVTGLIGFAIKGILTMSRRRRTTPPDTATAGGKM